MCVDREGTQRDKAGTWVGGVGNLGRSCCIWPVSTARLRGDRTRPKLQKVPCGPGGRMLPQLRMNAGQQLTTSAMVPTADNEGRS